MRIIFFGSDPWFSEPVLEALLAAGFEVPVAVTKGEEGNRFMSLLVHKFGREGKIRVVEGKNQEEISKKRMVKMARTAEMTKFSGRLTVQPFNRSDRLFAPDAIILASFGPPFLPSEILNWPKYGCLNVHASLLPRWRGASPIFAALAAGDKETGVSIMRMSEEIDRGPILGQAKITIRQPVLSSSRANDSESRDPATAGSDISIASLDFSTPLRSARNNGKATDTRETLTKRLGILGGELIVETLKKLKNGQITEADQPEKSPTPYTRRLTKDSGRIDWRFRPGETSPERSRRIERFIRAVTPWPGAWTEYKAKGQGLKAKKKTIKILKAHLSLPPALGPSLVIDEVQLPGKNPVSWRQFLAGHPEVSFFPLSSDTYSHPLPELKK